ncbi:ATP-binding protein [Clostridium vincentii]|uniref:Replication factor C large subunit n=1 Tax=Clostridium vincentii TaxID=52704 RepID=A0A2T0BHD2_9CLOT|nr:ATP-binding protein [Clostridium vincentii]PRR83309.1 replication factor C large subunit [Clostridium vincentii]
MEQEEKIKLYLDSLCVYKGIFKEKVGDKFNTLVDKISIDSSFGECIVAYNEFTYSLFSVSKDLSFKEGIVDEMLLNSNPFNVMVEGSEEVAPFIIQGIKAELECLGKIALVNSTTIKEIFISKFGENQLVKKRIDSLLHWGINNIDYIAKKDSPFEKIKLLLMNSNEWASCTDDIVDFHKKNGTGRVTAYGAFVWERYDNDQVGHLREIKEPDPVRLSNLIGYESQKKEIISNTKQFLMGAPANNLLLYGARGTGKSSTVKAILNEYSNQGLRLIEVDKKQLSDFTRIIRLLKNKKQKFIIFVDDLVFDENEDSYSALKTILEGKVENRPSNIIIYATTNRRHLVSEKFSDRDDVNSKDTMEEKLSLADRFGITISFFTPNQKEFLIIVDGIVNERGLIVDEGELHREALKWEKWHNGRSPRSANQFVDWLQGMQMSGE